MAAYYNEIDPYAAQWLRNLIAGGHIAPGDVDERSIVEVQPNDLKGYTQCHFFAGIGGWSLALRLALWPDDRPVWTGSCPCQPFSAAGKQKGHGDERHLWPYWYRLIRESKPATIFGEQVASAITFGWMDEVFNDLEKENYACAAAVLPACSVGAPHKRNRLWFMGNSKHYGQPAKSLEGITGETVPNNEEGKNGASESARASESLNVAYASGERLPEWKREPLEETHWNQESKRFCGDDEQWLACPDGKLRLVKSGIRLLANGVPGRVGAIKGYGNAIVPQAAAEFIKASWECIA